MITYFILSVTPEKGEEFRPEGYPTSPIATGAFYRLPRGRLLNTSPRAATTLQPRYEEKDCHHDQQDKPHQQEGYRAGAFRRRVHFFNEVTSPASWQPTHRGPLSPILSTPTDKWTLPPRHVGHSNIGTNDISKAVATISNNPPTRKVIPRPEGRELGKPKAHGVIALGFPRISFSTSHCHFSRLSSGMVCRSLHTSHRMRFTDPGISMRMWSQHAGQVKIGRRAKQMTKATTRPIPSGTAPKRTATLRGVMESARISSAIQTSREVYPVPLPEIVAGLFI